MEFVSPSDLRMDNRLQLQRNRLVKDIDMRQPVKIGHFSINKGGPDGSDERVFIDDDRNLMQIVLPKDLDNVAFDLTEGYVPLSEGGRQHCVMKNTGLVELFKWIINHRDKFALQAEDKKSTCLNTDFVAYRGTLTQMMVCPYERFDDLLIHAQKFNGTIYLNMVRSPEKQAKDDNRDEFLNQLSYGGLHFEEFITKPLHPPREDSFKSDGHDELCCMVRTRLKSHSLVYGAEMDCVDKPGNVEELSLSNFIEIKTTRMINSDRDYDNWSRKLVKWWAQSYMIGLSKLVCGYRDDNLVVRKLEKMNIHDFPSMGSRFWSHAVCLNWLNEFLTFMKTCAKEEGCIYKFYWRPKSDVVCFKSFDTQLLFVPDWYKSAILNTDDASDTKSS